MPLTIHVCNGQHAPVVVCDHCNKCIENARDGNMMWLLDIKETAASRIAFTHKECCHAFECATPNVHWLAAELSHSMIYLANNLEMDEKAWTSAEAGARLLSQL